MSNTQDKIQRTKVFNAEVRKAKAESKGFGVFVEKIDQGEYFEKEFGDIDEKQVELDKERYLEKGVEIVRDQIENPMGDEVKDFHGYFLTDQHKEDPERNRQEAIKGYKLLRFVDRLGYKVSGGIENVKNLLTSPWVMLKASVNFIGTIGNQKARERAYKDMIEEYPDSADKLKSWWNVFAVVHWELKRHFADHDLKKIIDDINGGGSTLDEWISKGRWEAREEVSVAHQKAMIKEFEEELPEDAENTVLMKTGDVGHDTATSAEHLRAREEDFELMDSIEKDVKKFIMKTWGNHDRDPREPDAMKEMFKLYGKSIFYQEVGGSEKAEKERVLVANLDTFVMAGQVWDDTFERYTEKMQEDGRINPEDIVRLREIKSLLNQAQKVVIEKMLNYEGDVVAVAHNPRRFLKYCEDNNIDLAATNIKRIVGGHVHQNTEYVVGQNRKEEDIIVNTTSSFVKIGKSNIELPDGMMISIDKEGNITVKTLSIKEKLKDLDPRILKAIKSKKKKKERRKRKKKESE